MSKWRLVPVVLAGMFCVCGQTVASADEKTDESITKQDAENPLPKDGFAQLIIRIFRDVGFTGPIRYEPERFRLVLGEGKGEGELLLGDAYSMYLDAPPSSRQQTAKRYVLSIRDVLEGRAQVPATFEAAKRQLLPEVTTRTQVELMNWHSREQGTNASMVACRPLAEHLAIAVAYDLPESRATLDQRTFSSWGVTFDEALAVALDNLRLRTSPKFVLVSPGVYTADWGDSYDLSRLLMPELFSQLKLKGAPVVGVPNRDTLLVTGTDDDNGLLRIVDLVNSEIRRPRSMSPMLFVWRDGDWSVFVPSPKSRAVMPILRQQKFAVVAAYEIQAERLRPMLAKAGAQVTLPFIRVYEKDEPPTVITATAWVKGEAALLPQTDEVLFADQSRPKGDTIHGRVQWKLVLEAVGGLMDAQDCYPPRFLVRDFPSDQQLNEMGLKK